MSPADKFGPSKGMSASDLKQVADIGQTLKAHGVTQDGGASQTPAVKYGAPDNSHRARSLSQERSR